MDTGEWVATAIAVLALAVSVVALIVAVRSASAAKSVRLAAASDRRAAPSSPAKPVVPPPPVGVVWKIEHDAGITWRLRNIGTEPAFDVNAVGLPSESAALVKLERSFADVPANGALGFHVVRTAHHPDVSGLAVTWGGQANPVIVSMV